MAQATSTGLGLGFVHIRVSVRVRFCGHYVDIVAAHCGRLRLQPTVTQNFGPGLDTLASASVSSIWPRSC